MMRPKKNVLLVGGSDQLQSEILSVFNLRTNMRLRICDDDQVDQMAEDFEVRVVMVAHNDGITCWVVGSSIQAEVSRNSDFMRHLIATVLDLNARKRGPTRPVKALDISQSHRLRAAHEECVPTPAFDFRSVALEREIERYYAKKIAKPKNPRIEIGMPAAQALRIGEDLPRPSFSCAGYDLYAGGGWKWKKAKKAASST